MEQRAGGQTEQASGRMCEVSFEVSWALIGRFSGWVRESGSAEDRSPGRRLKLSAGGFQSR